MCICVGIVCTLVQGPEGRQKRTLDPMELEVYIGSCEPYDMDDGNQTLYEQYAVLTLIAQTLKYSFLYPSYWPRRCLKRTKRKRRLTSSTQVPETGFVCLILIMLGHIWVQVHTESRRGDQIIWSWSYRWLWVAKHGTWEPNSSPLQEQ